jgi:hypothetical protein
MGAIGTNRTYTVTAAKSTWATTSGSVTLSQYTQGTVAIILRATLEVSYSGSYPRTIYVYTNQTAGGAWAYTQTAASSTSPASFNLPSGTYWVSRRNTYGGSGAVPVKVTVVDGTTLAITIGSGN